ncbi:MAG: glycosyltransferase [Bacteroidetes bacterium]|nr:glycosyltransferase [Bacteroidota bacterium]
MEFTGERFIPLKELMKDEIAFEHLHRYHAAKGLAKGKIVLDIACGEGYGSEILSTYAKKVIGIDIDEKTIEHAKNKYKNEKIDFLRGSTDSIPLPDHSVDIAISYETIEHINEESQRIFLGEIKRVLKKDGVFIISTPDKINYSDRYDHKNEFHLKEFEKEEFISFLNKYFTHTSCFLQGYEIVGAITETSPEEVKDLHVINWPREFSPFTRKYLIGICSDNSNATRNFSSIVFQVNRNYLETMDTLVEKEAYILELSNWGKSLDKEIEEKNKIIQDQQKKTEDLAYFKELHYKQTVTIENLSTFAKEKAEMAANLEKTTAEKDAIIETLQQLNINAENNIKEKNSILANQVETLNLLKRVLDETLVEKDAVIEKLQQSNINAENTITEKNNILASQVETINLLKDKIEEHSNIILSLEENNRQIKELNKDKEDILRQLRDREKDIFSQLESKNQRLTEIYASEGWKVLNMYYKLKGRLIPEHSARYKYLKKAFNKLRGKQEATSPVGIPELTEVKTFPVETIEAPVVFHNIEFKSFQAPVVSIIIPVYNGWAMTYKCLKSIYENTKETAYEIIIADDGATDETKNIENYIRNITVIKNETNLGFLDNCNNASKRAQGEFILFLNNDTEVRPGWLSSLTELMQRDPSIGMTGSKFIYPDGKLQEAGGIIWKDASAWNFGHKKSPDAPEFNYVKEADYISGAGIMIRKKLWEEIGGFDRRYAPAYCEDSDLAFEVRERGFKVVFQPLSKIIHYEGYSHGTDETGTTVKAYQKLNNEKLREKWKKVLLKDHFPNGENVFWAKDRTRYKKTILVIDHYVPHYDKDAGSKTVFQYLKLFVALNLNVKFIGDNFFRHEPYTTTLQQMGIEVLYGPWYAENWQQWLKENHDKFDYVLLNRPHISVKYIDFIRDNTTAKILYYGHDLHFMRMLKQYEIENKKELLKDAEKWKKIETSLFNKVDIVLTPSEQEKKMIDELGVTTPVYPIKPYIFDFIPEPINDFSERKDILFVGGFTHGPNADAVIWFVKEVWPLIKKKIPGAKFIVVGSNVPPEIMALSDDDTHIIGFLSETDLKKLYNKIKMVVIPLRYGAGVKGKTVEAMYNGIPFVATEFGIEGLPGSPGFLASKNNADEFAKEVIRLYNAPDSELKELSKMETKYIHDHFHLESVKKEFLKILDTITVNTDAV